MATDFPPGSPAQVNALLAAPDVDVAETLFILSAGFDPRCAVGLERFIAANGSVPHVLMVEPQGAQPTIEPEMQAARVDNVARINALATRGCKTVSYPEVHDDAGAGRSLSRTITDAKELAGIRSVVFDLSAFPTSLAFPILSGLLSRVDQRGSLTELQVVVTENPGLDGAIVHSSLGDAHALPGFRRPKQQDAGVRVWTPVLGADASVSLEKIAKAIDPREICPVLPFPARDPKIVDRLLMSHSRFFEANAVSPTSFIYAAETNPFDLYRTLVRYELDCQATLKPLGGAHVTVSSHGSKLLSVGALLAAFEQKMSFFAVRANGRSLDSSFWSADSRDEDRVACLWLAGEPYSE